MPRTLLEVNRVWKRYSLRPRSHLRDATADTLRELAGLPARRGLREGEFWALEDVDLRIDAGEVVGVIGHNGAGKSTLMNLVSGIILPTMGSIAIHTDKVCRIDQGGVLSTQETGRENIRMQLALHGVPVAETESETEAIASFADLHDQLDAAVGTYSSGMRSRLGFAIYARLHPDLFLVDEGIGGGDQRFRERFRGFLAEYVAAGGAMLFAMHDTHMIQTLCDRVLLLDGGRAVLTAEPTAAIDAYNRLAAERGLPPLPLRRQGRVVAAAAPMASAPPGGAIQVDSITVVDAAGQPPRPGRPADVIIACRADEPLDDVVPVVEISRGEIAPLATLRGGVVTVVPPGITFRCRIRSLALVPGEYDVRVAFHGVQSRRCVGAGRATFRVGAAGPRASGADGRGGLLHLRAAWEAAPLVDPGADDGCTFRDDPYPIYRRWLAEPGPFHSQRDNAWIVSRYDQVSALFRSPSITSRTEKVGLLGDTMVANDPPEHGRLRGLVADAFSAPAVRDFEPTIEAIVADILDGLADEPTFDFVDRVADVLPVRVMSSLLGLPEADLPRLRVWAGEGTVAVDVAENMRHLAAFFAAVVAQRRGDPGGDLVSRLVAAHDPGGRASMAEILATCVLTIVAGHETTAGAIGSGMLLLLQHPDQYARLRADPRLIGPAIEEMLRCESPLQYPSPRATKESVEIGGRTIPAGDRVLLCLGAANRDPAVFPDPDRFDIGRTPNRHIAFAQGVHICLGAALFRAEARILFTRLNERFGELRLDVADPRTYRPDRKPAARLRRLARLPVRR